MSVSQPPSDAPFGLQPNVAAGLAYLFPLIGGIIMLVGGGTNKFVKFAAAQSIAWPVCYIIVQVVLTIINIVTGFHLGFIVGIIALIVWVLGIVAWLWTFIMGFQGKEVRLPMIGDLTENVFKGMLA